MTSAQVHIRRVVHVAPGDDDHARAAPLDDRLWRIDPARSSVEFEVPTLWGLTKVAGRFERYDGTLDLRRTPAVELSIDADSVATNNARRDKHLRSDDFLGADAHPRVRFVSDTVTVDGEHMTLAGTLHAAGGSAPLRVEATLRDAGTELEFEAAAEIDQRQLGMTFTLLGLVGAPTKLVVHGRLVTSGGA